MAHGSATRPASPAHKDHKVTLGRKVTKVHKDRKVNKDHRVSLDKTGLKDHKDPRDHKDHKVTKARKVLKDHKVPPDRTDHKERPVKWAQSVRKGKWGLKGLRVKPELKARKVNKAYRASKE